MARAHRCWLFRARVSDEQAQLLPVTCGLWSPVGLAPPGAPANDFEKSCRGLQNQWNELRRQLQELSKPPQPVCDFGTRRCAVYTHVLQWQALLVGTKSLHLDPSLPFL